MKNIILSLALVLPLVLSAQYSSDYLQRLTESGITGWRFSTAVAANYGNIGDEAVDLSYSDGASTTRGATGLGALAMGDNTTASGDYSTAIGAFTNASGSVSTAMGDGTTASGYASTAIGENTTASGGVSTAMGYSTTASGNVSTATGENTTASGGVSTAMGEGTIASGWASTAMGEGTIASGEASTAMGVYTTASDYASLTIGRYNSVNKTVTAGGNATSFDTDNAAFVIGNGTASNALSDAFVVRFNGDATLSGDLTINSDERLKDNIQPLGSTLNKLHQIEAKTYSLKKDEEHTPKIGVLAQEVQAVFPELVTEGADGILSVNYQGLVPVLINAINEQEVKIAALEAQNAEIKELKEMVRVLALQQSQTTSSVAAN